MKNNSEILKMLRHLTNLVNLAISWEKLGQDKMTTNNFAVAGRE